MARRESRKGKLVNAALRLVARDGAEAVSVRAITQAAGMTEAALYRHYKSKSDLFAAIFRDIIDRMLAEKQEIARSQASIDEKLRRWISTTLSHFDASPDEFTYVLLTAHDFPPAMAERMNCQGDLFCATIEAAQRAGRARYMPAALALSFFTGLVLNVPRMINEKRLRGPASKYAEAVFEAVWRVFAPATD